MLYIYLCVVIYYSTVATSQLLSRGELSSVQPLNTATASNIVTK